MINLISLLNFLLLPLSMREYKRKGSEKEPLTKPQFSNQISLYTFPKLIAKNYRTLHRASRLVVVSW